jgi:hypothetical protein
MRAAVAKRQHTSAHASIRQHTSAYASMRMRACVAKRQHTSTYASIRQHTLRILLGIREHTCVGVGVELAVDAGVC